MTEKERKAILDLCDALQAVIGSLYGTLLGETQIKGLMRNVDAVKEQLEPMTAANRRNARQPRPGRRKDKSK